MELKKVERTDYAASRMGFSGPVWATPPYRDGGTWFVKEVRDGPDGEVVARNIQCDEAGNLL